MHSLNSYPVNKGFLPFTWVVPNDPCMDPEPADVPRALTKVEETSLSYPKEDVKGIKEEEPFSLSGPSIALLGLTIAIATVGTPLAAVLVDRPLGGRRMVPTAMERDGSKPSVPISLIRAGKPRS